MTSRDFCFWLQGYFEISGDATPSAGQVEIIKKHLALVFKHEIDPSMGDSDHQNDLNKIHGSKNPVPGIGPVINPNNILRC